MSLTVDSKFPPLTFTDNDLLDVVNFIKEMNIVALYSTKVTRIFHIIPFIGNETSQDLKHFRVIYLDCSSDEGLLNEGEWERVIKKEIKYVKELFDSHIRNIIIHQKLVPNKEYLALDELGDN